MKVLVTGGAGYIGSFTCRALIAHGLEINVLDDFSTGHRTAVPDTAKIFECNLLDADAVGRIVADGHYDGIIHFAAKSLVGESVTEPLKYYQNNICGSVNLLSAAHKSGVKNFVFSSTAAVYGNPVGELTEEHPLSPINPYGRSKLAVEMIARDMCAAYGLKCIPLRYFNAAGAAEDGSFGEDHRPETHLIPLALTAALGARPPLQVFGNDYPSADGTPVRDYVHVSDLAEAHVLALLSLEQVAPGYFKPMNVGTGVGTTVLQVLKAIESELDRPVPFTTAPRREGDPVTLVANAACIQATIGWRPRCSSIAEIIATAGKWHREYPEGYSGKR